MHRENGYIFLDVWVECDDLEAYNFTRHICGCGDDMRDWENAGDIWGGVTWGSRLSDGKYAISISEEQFTDAEMEEIERG